MRKTALVTWMLFLGLTAEGCVNVASSDWSAPGPAAVQQGRAQQFDPYPQPDVGPEVEGGRPRDYQIPVAESARSRWVLSHSAPQP